MFSVVVLLIVFCLTYCQDFTPVHWWPTCLVVGSNPTPGKHSDSNSTMSHLKIQLHKNIWMNLVNASMDTYKVNSKEILNNYM